jgi:hypothetical protein
MQGTYADPAVQNVPNAAASIITQPKAASLVVKSVEKCCSQNAIGNNCCRPSLWKILAHASVTMKLETLLLVAKSLEFTAARASLVMQLEI